MTSNFTPRAQQVLLFARQEAERLHHNFLGTEHLLLGLIMLGQGVAVNVLLSQGVNLDKLRAEVEKQIGTGPEQPTAGHIPYTPQVKKVIALANKEAQQLHHTYVGTEHLLLGLLRDDGVAAKVLEALKVNLEQTRIKVLRELDPNFAQAIEGEPQEIVLPPKPSAPPRLDMAGDVIDTSKRYDVYASDLKNEITVYRNVLFRGAKKLFAAEPGNLGTKFIELEHADGKVIYLAMYAIVKFCEAGTPAGGENIQP